MSTNLNQPNYYSGGSGTPNKNDNSKRLLTIAAITIAALLGTTIFLLVNKYKTEDHLEQTVKQLDSKEEAYNALNLQFTDAVSQLEQMKTQNVELNAKIDEQIAQLTEQKAKIAEGIRSKGDLKAARAEIQALVKQKDDYVLEVTKLREEVAALAASNTELNQKNTSLNQDLTTTKTKLEEESTAKAALISEKTVLETDNKQLAKKVDIASAIKVSGIEIKPLMVKSSGKEKTKSRASKVDKVKICFNAEANDVVPAGEEKFYLRIIDPTGAPLVIESLGSGIAQNKKTENEFRYTTTATTNYANAPTNVCGEWLPGVDFMKGKYQVEVYNKGFLVGTSEFKLK
jgi:predicted  nucleic acid-binding Zn-ribbon protein